MSASQITTKVNYSYPSASRAGEFMVVLRKVSGTSVTQVKTMDAAMALALSSDAKAATILTPRPSHAR